MFIGQQLPEYFIAPAERNVIGKSISLLRSENATPETSYWSLV